MRRGLTLIELLVTLAIVGVVTVSVTQAYIAGINYEQTLRESREEAEAPRRFEDRISSLLRRAYLSADPNDTSTYFIGGAGVEGVGAGAADTVTFTTAGQRLAASVLEADETFEEAHERLGPQGGVAEISISRNPAGEAPVQEGLFLREQRPSDGDPTQGGFERILSEEAQEVEFEFFDGTEWATMWDTRTGQKRLPAAIRVSFLLGDESNRRSIVVRLPASDITPANPLTIGGE